MMHFFSTDITNIPFPKQFTYPFYYKPHQLCIKAAEEVQLYLKNKHEWKEELQQGKMFGVLIVQDTKGETGYLAAFSGTLAGSYLQDYFVPPVYNLLISNGYFKQEEKEISKINQQIEHIKSSQENILNIEKIKELEHKAKTAITQARAIYKKEKLQREEKRKSLIISFEELEIMKKESQFQKAEIKRLEKKWTKLIDEQKNRISFISQSINKLKDERKIRSAALQQWIFAQFKLLNAQGEIKDLCELFTSSFKQTPPSGAGECAAPKLLQYAYKQGFKPICMAEFWWGNSPKGEIRHHGYYYPACKQKCEPILKHMLKGLDVEPNPLSTIETTNDTLKSIYEDESILIVSKPSGMLTVPGKSSLKSVYNIIVNKYPNATGPLIVHRLDMDTSGLLVIAKNKEAHANLQKQFENQTIKKKYIALLSGIVKQTACRGIIRIPIRPDVENRPLQIVDYDLGKPTVTRFEILEQTQIIINGERKDCTRIAFYPQTGRTHQLRVHSAHTDGLNSPIIGDSLYGQTADRLYLHAELIEFKHPTSGKTMLFKEEAPF